MKIIAGIVFYFVSPIILIFAQSNGNLESLQSYYESFEYFAVINKANNLLLEKDKFSDQSLILVYSVKAASHFAIGDKENSRKSFIELLKIDNGYKLNVRAYSPKLISSFNEVKSEFLDILKLNNKIVTRQRTLKHVNVIPNPIFKNEDINSAIAKSLVLPGWGHLHLNDNTKGWILTSTGAVILGSMLYFIFDANKKESDYLSATDHYLIQSKYTDYNKSYKIRNLFIAGYAAIWLFSQIDLLFFSNEVGATKISSTKKANVSQVNSDRITFTLHIPF